MKQIQTIFTTGALLASIFAHAEIREIKSFKEAAAISNPDTVVLFDLDNTLMEAPQTLGTDQWGSFQAKRLKEQGVNEQEAADRGVEMFVAVQQKSAERLVEGDRTANFVHSLQKRGFTVMGLTSRPPELAAKTLDQLKSLGLDLSQTAATGRAFTVNQAPLAIFRRGVIFAGPHNTKADTLLKFYQGLNESLPKHIVYFDDKAHHVQNLEEVIAGRTDYIGYRYGAADKRVASMDVALGDFEWMIFQKSGVILSDDDAEQLQKDGPQKISDTQSWAEKTFKDELSSSADGRWGSDGCKMSRYSSGTEQAYCTGFVTELVHGGAPFRSKSVVEYSFVPANDSSSYYVVENSLQ